ncbi:hypothetical protein [Candidatus Nitrosotalea okcheonensis]|uniref:Uncharacterized protein n=1 Tax=Candidatus Nitrosotalea okcheonensis TaxID=1903276 RepID=A0A2H1FGV5_9ARCH|nr:hypothetical protein [Candidatus Nitrosotalea okcheonensis]SMH71987.1 conserved protein of unknown function [Candidatus Nitrosotalea okcheonensis]
MIWDEIEIPKEVRHFMLEEAEETVLGQKNGAKKQYRYGNLHIREYDDKYLVHMDKVDPRKDPLGHIIQDAPEIIVGITSGLVAAKKVSSSVYKLQKNMPFVKGTSLLAGLVASVLAGYAGYTITKKLKEF